MTDLLGWLRTWWNRPQESRDLFVRAVGSGDETRAALAEVFPICGATIFSIDGGSPCIKDPHEDLRHMTMNGLWWDGEAPAEEDGEPKGWPPPGVIEIRDGSYRITRGI